MATDKIVTKKLRFEVVTIDCPDTQEFDLEEWLANILVDYWQSLESGDHPE